MQPMMQSVPQQFIDQQNKATDLHNERLRKLVEAAFEYLKWEYQTFPEYAPPECDLDQLTKDIEEKEQFLEEMKNKLRIAYDGMDKEKVESLLDLQVMPLQQTIDQMKKHLSSHLKEGTSIHNATNL